MQSIDYQNIKSIKSIKKSNLDLTKPCILSLQGIMNDLTFASSKNRSTTNKATNKTLSQFFKTLIFKFTKHTITLQLTEH